VIGNSTALFQIEPAVIRAELARSLPGREVRVVPLLLPMLKTADELLLVKAALAKQADVVVATPALRGLEAGDSLLSPLLREAFAGDRPPRTGVAALESLLADRLALLRYGGELRALLLRRFARLLRRGSEAERRRRLDEDLALVTRVARGGNVAELRAVYESRGLSALLRTDLRGDLLSASSPVWSMLEEMANALVGHESRGVAIFMPANPLLRGVGPARQSGQLDDAWVRELVELALRPFAEAGWQVLDALDALPAEAFVDLVHVHGREHAEAMSIRAANLVVRALSEAPAAPGTRSTPPRPPT